MKRISRRALLRGAGGVAVGLPALEIMTPASVAAAEPPKRYVVCYAGTSIGRRSGTSSVDVLTPSSTGLDYPLSPALAPVDAHGVKDHVSVVSGLRIPWDAGSGVPAAGRARAFHGTTVVPQISGTRALSRYDPPKGATSDRIVATANAGATPHPALNYRVQPATYGGANQTHTTSGRISWRVTSSGTPVALDPIVSPRLAYTSLFTGFVPDDVEHAARLAAELERRRSALDLVKGAIDRLLPRLGTRDRQRMERHFDEVRALEKRLEAVTVPQGACELPMPPGDDPPIGDAIVGDDNAYATNGGYSGEDERAEVLADLIRMAFVCDLSRVSAFQLTMWKCWMNLFPISGHAFDLHETSHGAGSAAALTAGVGWHVDVFARLVAKLADSQDASGTSVLDHTALVLLFEGGIGYDPEADRDHSSHSTENMVALIAGYAGGLAPGRHLHAPGRHPAELVASAMHAVGVSGGLNDVTTHIEEVFA